MLEFQDWGLIAYDKALTLQEKYVELLSEDKLSEVVIFCRHPSIVTLGRGTQPQDVGNWKGETYTTNRGGRATYHGPGQIVVYPILDLARSHGELRPKDLHGYLRLLEKAMVESLATCGLKAENSAGKSGTGVWIDERKIASLGIAVRKWISYHGMAVNLEEDPIGLSGFSPCGLSADIMTSVQGELGYLPDRDQLQNSLKDRLSQVLSPKSLGRSNIPIHKNQFPEPLLF